MSLAVRLARLDDVPRIADLTAQLGYDVRGQSVAAHRFYARLSYAHIKTQFSFVKVGPAEPREGQTT